MIYLGLICAALHFGLGIAGFERLSVSGGLFAIALILWAMYDLLKKI